MDSRQQQVISSLEKIEVCVQSASDYTGGLITRADGDLMALGEDLRLLISEDLAAQEAVLTRAISILALKATLHIERAYFHASPGLMAVLAAIWGTAVAIWEGVKFVVNIITTIQALHIDDLLAEIWPAFRRVRDEFRRRISEFSRTIGWGVDGALHLIHACQGTRGVWAGLTGKSMEWLDIEWMEKTERVLAKIENNIRYVEDNPGDILEMIFQIEGYWDRNEAETWGVNLFATIDEGLERGQRALEAAGSVTSELAAIQEGMPEIVKKHIPKSIWDALESADAAINDTILPRLSAVSRRIDEIQASLDYHLDFMKRLNERVRLPGTNLLTIEDLPEWARNAEYGAVDSVASHEIGAGNTQDILSLESNLEAFLKIDEALRAPTPEPEALTLEAAPGKKIRGVTLEPHETWMIGGYDSTY